MDIELVKEALAIATARQQRYDFAPPSEEKMKAKTFARDAVYQRLREKDIDPMHCVVLDVGHEPYYSHLFYRIESANLPEYDIHDLGARKSRAIMAMHVIEHSPFPLLALLSMKRAMVPGGLIYVSVPIADKPFITDPCHFSVLRNEQWEKLFIDAGLRITHASLGKFNNYRTAEEWRYILE